METVPQSLPRRRRRETRTLVHLAISELREAILSGELPPGSPLPLRELEEHLSMSSMPVREALRHLELVGLVEQFPHRGTRVAGTSIKELEDIYSLRMVLETLAVRRAAQRMTEADYEHLRLTLSEYEGAYRQGDEPRGREAHKELHFGLYELAEQPWLLKLIDLLWDNAERYRRMSVKARGTLEDRMREHEHILEACRRGDPEAAEQAIAEHLRRTMDTIKAELEQEEGSTGSNSGHQSG